MRHAAGEDAEALELLHLEQLALHFFLLACGGGARGDVERDADEAGDAAVGLAPRRAVQLEQGAVELALAGEGFPGQRAPDVGDDVRPGGVEVEGGLADRFAGLAADRGQTGASERVTVPAGRARRG